MDYLIVFADLISSTEVAVELDPENYAKEYIASFNWSVLRAEEFVRMRIEHAHPRLHFEPAIQGVDPRGDEAICFQSIDATAGARDGPDLVASAVAWAYVTKLFWMAAPYNLRRIVKHQFPRDIAFGLHIGPAAIVPCTKKEAIASLHINMTKRIESEAREGGCSRIFASVDVIEKFQEWQYQIEHVVPKNQLPPLYYTGFEPREPLRPNTLKGLSIPVELWELVPEVFLPKNLPYLFGGVGHLVDPNSVAGVMAKGMAETFFGTCFFHGADNELAIKFEIPGINDPKTYVDTWFSALEGRTRLFMGEPWTLFNCYFISCAFIHFLGADGRDRKPIVEELFASAKRAWERTRSGSE